MRPSIQFRYPPPNSHSKNARLGLVGFTSDPPGNRQRASQDDPSVGRRDDGIIPETSGGKIRRRLAIKLLLNWMTKFSLLLLRPAITPRFDPIPLHGGQHSRCLLSSHHPNPSSGPHIKETRTVGPTAHAVIASSKTASQYESDLRNLCRRHRIHKLRSILGNTFVLIFLADHKTGNVLQEEDRNTSLTAELHKVCCLESTLTE
mmetsp:Transcript_9976/g.23612  ORF Transcript_9976/g.23612 Transcript_9976/m.23612 type:complete len:204 (+) Transcript_9976:120-731(+)